MAKSKIFMRESGKGRYRYAVVAVQGEEVQFYEDLLSKEELEAIAKEVDGDLFLLKTAEEIHIDEEEQGIERDEGNYEEVE
jgi:hypothetical protein